MFGFAIVGLFLCVFLGPYCPCSWIVLLDYFQQKSFSAATTMTTASGVDHEDDEQQQQQQVTVSENRNEQRRKMYNKIKSMLSGSSFAVFLIHYLVLTIYMYLYIEVLEQTQDITIHFVNTTVTAEIIPGPQLSDGNKFGGFFFVAFFTLVTSFLIGILMKRIPYVGKYL